VVVAAAGVMLRDSSSPKVYVTNIPYDVKEDAMRRILERAGPILTFDLLKKEAGHVDREHGGAGWCTYGTPAYAQNAIRLLNGFHVQGRTLRVAPSENKSA
jgi:RNA recognition motif-containing protein